MYKIALVATNLAGSGAEKVVLNLARMFEKKGNEVHIFLLEDMISYETGGLNIHTLSKKRDLYKMFKGLGDYLLAIRLKRKMETLCTTGERFDLILSNLPAADRVVSMADLPHTYYLIHTAYSMEIEEFHARKKHNRAQKKERLYHRLYRDKDLIAVSHGIKEDLDSMRVAYRSCEVIYNPFDFETIRKMADEKSEIAIEGEYLLSASAFRPVKRYDVLLEAYSQLTDAPPLKLLCNPAPELEKLIEKFNLTKKVEILGFTSNPYPVIKQAKMLILSSEREGLPTVLIEALILGTPVVSTDCKSGPSEILTGELHKYLAKVNDSMDLSNKIQQCLNDEVIMTEEYLGKFDAASIYHQYIRLKQK
jgi:glycosyltransferase involved in cell wall biosynthesis